MVKCHYEELQLNSEVIAVVKYHKLLETLRIPKTISRRLSIKYLCDFYVIGSSETIRGTFNFFK